MSTPINFGFSTCGIFGNFKDDVAYFIDEAANILDNSSRSENTENTLMEGCFFSADNFIEGSLSKLLYLRPFLKKEDIDDKVCYDNLRYAIILNDGTVQNCKNKRTPTSWIKYIQRRAGRLFPIYVADDIDEAIGLAAMISCMN